MRTIALEQMRFHSLLGLHPEEKILGNELEVSIYITVESPRHREDKLEQTLDYVQVYETVRAVLSEPMDLLETAVHRIHHQVKTLGKQVKGIKVRVCKLHPPIAGLMKCVFVEEEWQDADNE